MGIKVQFYTLSLPIIKTKIHKANKKYKLNLKITAPFMVRFIMHLKGV